MSDAPDVIAPLMSDHRSTLHTGHAIVIGGGTAGLLTARVLACHFRQVTLIERDGLTGGAQVRKGAPQGRMLHVMLPGGQRLWNGCFPVSVTNWRPLGRCRCAYPLMRWC